MPSSIDDIFLFPHEHPSGPIAPTHRGLLANEMPLKPNVCLGGNLPRGLSFSSEDRQVYSALSCLLANVMLASWQPATQWVFYSRDHNHYAAVRTLAPAWYTRRAIIMAVDVLLAAGLVEARRTAPSPSARLRSRVRATPSLAAVCGAQSLRDLCWAEPPPLILRDRGNRKLLDPRTALTPDEFVQFQLMARDVEAHNSFLSHFTVGLQGARVIQTGHLEMGGDRINPLQRSYRRVFNGNLQLGGRWYGPWWQGLSGSLRQHLTLDGEPTVELDFAACQLRLLLAKCGCPDPLAGHIRHPDPNFDLYRVEGADRNVVKSALIFMVNADDRRRARAALSRKLSQRGEGQARRRAGVVMQSVEAAFPLLRPFWFTGVGLELQSVDAEVCTAVQRSLRDLDLPVLSIHDSFITFRHAEAILYRAMRDRFNAAYTALANS